MKYVLFSIMCINAGLVIVTRSDHVHSYRQRHEKALPSSFIPFVDMLNGKTITTSKAEEQMGLISFAKNIRTPPPPSAPPSMNNQNTKSLLKRKYRMQPSLSPTRSTSHY